MRNWRKLTESLASEADHYIKRILDASGEIEVKHILTSIPSTEVFELVKTRMQVMQELEREIDKKLVKSTDSCATPTEDEKRLSEMNVKKLLETSDEEKKLEKDNDQKVSDDVVLGLGEQTLEDDVDSKTYVENASNVTAIKGIKSEDYMLNKDRLRGIYETGLQMPSPIQEETIPIALTGRDILAKANTGKTGAFCIPTVEKIDPEQDLIQDAVSSLQVFPCEGRVTNLGSRFMTIYISKLGSERRIYYDQVEGLRADWLEATSTLILDKLYAKRDGGGFFRPLKEVAYVVSPCDQLVAKCSALSLHDTEVSEIVPRVFPLTVQLFSTIPVVLHAVGGDDGRLYLGARLYMSSYYK